MTCINVIHQLLHGAPHRIGADPRRYSPWRVAPTVRTIDSVGHYLAELSKLVERVSSDEPGATAKSAGHGQPIPSVSQERNRQPS